MHTFPLDRVEVSVGSSVIAEGFCFLWVWGSCLLVLLWFLAPGKQMRGVWGACLVSSVAAAAEVTGKYDQSGGRVTQVPFSLCEAIVLS